VQRGSLWAQVEEAGVEGWGEETEVEVEGVTSVGLRGGAGLVVMEGA